MKRHYIELWLLLLSAFVIFAVASSFDMPIKSSGIAATLLQHEEKPEPVVAAPYYEPQVVAMQCDTASHTILFIGDSMVEGLGPRLAAYAEHNGHTLYSVIWYSSTSETWGRSDKLRKYIDKIKPSYIFVCLGANELFVKNIVGQRKKYVDSILSDIGSIPYVWIGPPNWAEDTGINDLIASSAVCGGYFKSKGMVFERKSDGAHPTPASACQWFDSVARWVPQNAFHPIRLEEPVKAVARPQRTFIHKPSEH